MGGNAFFGRVFKRAALSSFATASCFYLGVVAGSSWPCGRRSPASFAPTATPGFGKIWFEFREAPRFPCRTIFQKMVPDFSKNGSRFFKKWFTIFQKMVPDAEPFFEKSGTKTPFPHLTFILKVNQESGILVPTAEPFFQKP